MGRKRNPDRVKESFQPHIDYFCETCNSEYHGPNALGLAAQHTDRTGHETRWQVIRTGRFRIEVEA